MKQCFICRLRERAHWNASSHISHDGLLWEIRPHMYALCGSTSTGSAIYGVFRDIKCLVQGPNGNVTILPRMGFEPTTFQSLAQRPDLLCMHGYGPIPFNVILAASPYFYLPTSYGDSVLVQLTICILHRSPWKPRAPICLHTKYISEGILR